MKEYDRDYYSDEYIIKREIGRRQYKLDRARSERFRNKSIKLGKTVAVIAMTLAIGVTVFITSAAIKDRIETQQYLDSLKEESSYSQMGTLPYDPDYKKWEDKQIWELIDEIKEDYEADHQDSMHK